MAQGHHRKFSILPLALGMAVPVAFIAGAAITSYISMSPDKSTEQETASAVQSGGSLDGQLWTLDEQKQCAVGLETARADAGGLRQQLEALQSQVIVATREKEEADRKVASALAGKAAAEAEVARVMTASASQMSDRLAPPGARESAGDAINALALASEREASSRALQGVADAVTTPEPGTPVTGVNVAAEPEPESSMDVTAAVTETAPELSSSSNRALTPRSSISVSGALSGAPGLDSLSGSARQDLEARLIRGECVSSSLATAFNNHVPVVPLRDLIRNLDSDC